MSATAEYYGYLLSLGYGETQLKKFAEYGARADRGEISHNQAYRLACKAGFGNADGWENADDAPKKTFGDWMNTAQEAGWIDSGLAIIGGLVNKPKGTSQGAYYPPPPPPKKNNTAIIVVGAIAVIGIGVAIYLATRKK